MRTVAWSEGGVIRLKNFSGAITITGTADAMVTLAATPYGAQTRFDSRRARVRVQKPTEPVVTFHD